MPRYGSFRGKGEALWKSLHETNGDIIVWADTDVRNWHPRMVYGTIGPLLHDHCDSIADILVRHPPAAMDVGQEPDTQSGEWSRQSGDRRRCGRELELVPSVEKSVRARPRDRADAGRRQRLQNGSASYRHTLLY